MSAVLRSPNEAGGEVPSARCGGLLLHLARVVLVIQHTSQFGSFGKCVHKLLALFFPITPFMAASASGSPPASVTNDRGVALAEGLPWLLLQLRDVFLISAATSSINSSEKSSSNFEHRVLHIFPGSGILIAKGVLAWNCIRGWRCCSPPQQYEIFDSAPTVSFLWLTWDVLLVATSKSTPTHRTEPQYLTSRTS